MGVGVGGGELHTRRTGSQQTGQSDVDDEVLQGETVACHQDGCEDCNVVMERQVCHLNTKCLRSQNKLRTQPCSDIKLWLPAVYIHQRPSYQPIKPNNHKIKALIHFLV